MTILAFARQRSVPDGKHIANLLLLVAARTGYFSMSPFQRIATISIMVKLYLSPTALIVTAVTHLLILTHRELPGVLVLMAGEAGGMFHLEIAILRSVLIDSHLVTNITGLRQMRAHQGEFRFGMVGGRELRRHKSLLGVAPVAISAIFAVGQLPPVRISVTVQTSLMRQLAGETPPLVTFVAGNLLVQSNQRKGGTVMIKIVRTDPLPA